MVMLAEKAFREDDSCTMIRPCLVKNQSLRLPLKTCAVLFYTISFKWLLCLFITDWLLSVPSALITSAQGQWQVLLSWNWIPKRLEDTNNVMWWCSSTHTTSTRGFVVCASHPLGNSSSALSYTEVTFKKPLASEILSLLKFSVSLEWVGIFPATSDLMAFSKIWSTV